MELLFKATAGVLIAVVLYHTIPGERKELKLMISIAVSVMISIAALRFLEPVMDFLEQLQDVGKLSTGIMEILVKAGDVRSPSPVHSFRRSRKEFDLPCILFYHTSLSNFSQIGLRRRKTIFPGASIPRRKARTAPGSLQSTLVSISSRI